MVNSLLGLVEATAEVPVANKIPTARNSPIPAARSRRMFGLTSDLLVPMLKVLLMLGRLFMAFGSLLLAWNQLGEFATRGIWATCVFATPASALVRCGCSTDAAQA